VDLLDFPLSLFRLVNWKHWLCATLRLIDIYVSEEGLLINILLNKTSPNRSQTKFFLTSFAQPSSWVTTR